MYIKVQHPEYIMFSSDYSQQEPKTLATVSRDPDMSRAFSEGKDIYATIASVAFNKPYEECLEFHPVTHEYQKEGKERRTQAKSIVLGITYGRSTVTIGEQLFGRNHEMSDDDKTKAAQHVYDSVLHAFPALKGFMQYAQDCARTKGYTETILGRRRHIPDMQLPRFEFKAMPGYVNPDVDPLDVSTLQNSSEIPERIVKQLTQEFSKLKYYGQVVKRTKELREQKIRVINNTRKITDATRQCVNCVDFETEILTKDGWKKYNEVNAGDKIVSYNLNTGLVENDTIEAVHIYEGTYDAYQFNSPTFESVCTPNHKWVTGTKTSSRLVEANKIYNNKWPDYSILRVSDNCFDENTDISDDELRVLGWLETDGSYYTPDKVHHMKLYQSCNRPKGQKVYSNMISCLRNMSQKYTDNERTPGYHELYLFKSEFTDWVRDKFPDRTLTFSFVSTLSQRQAKILLQSMMDGDGIGEACTGYFVCSTIDKANVFQYLCFAAGYASNMYVCEPDKAPHKGNVPNGSVVQTKCYYRVSVLKVKNAQIYPHHKSKITCHGVWCVTTNNHTWVCRKNGKVSITGNSIVQGSAADLTKMALLNLEYNDRWHQIGGRMLVPVHDELICEVPVDFYEEGRDILKDSMEEAGNFMPFPIYCDVETTLRWYGMSYPCEYSMPTSFSLSSVSTLSKGEISWIQWHLIECEYQLPTFPDENGEAPIGDAAKGVNGIVSDELISYIKDYMNTYNVTDESFISHIDKLVTKGLI